MNTSKKQKNNDENIITYFCNTPKPQKIRGGGDLRFFNLVENFSKLGNANIISVRTKYPILNSDLLRFPALFLKALSLRSRLILFSYPNFPFLPGERNKPFGFSTLFLMLLKLLKKAKNLKIVVDADDLPGLKAGYYSLSETKKRINKKHLRFFEQTLFRLADIIWVVSKREKELIQQNYGSNESKFFIVPNGNMKINLPPKKLPSNKVKFIYAGVLYKEMKVLTSILDAFKEIKGQNIELYLAGSKGDWIREEYQSKNIIHLGSLSHTEAEQYVKACDIGVLPYSAEERNFDTAFPVKLALYITNEKPVLSLDSPTVKEFIDKNQVGITCSLSSFKNQVIKLALDNNSRKEFAKNCRKIKESLFWDTIFKRAFEYSFEA